MSDKHPVKGVIFDIDGTLVSNNQPLPGAIEALASLRARGVMLRLVTNTTSRTAEQLGAVLRALGFDIQDNEIMTSVDMCLDFLRQNYHDQAGYLAIPEGIQSQFAKIRQTSNYPAFVVLGDLDEAFDYEVLNRVFNYMRNGAQLITFHRNPFFFRNGKTWLDSGAFTLALELICDKKAIVTGKPSPEMFERAVLSMGLEKHEVIVVGDDVSSDMMGAKQAGLTGYLVATGKFKPEHVGEHRLSEKLLLKNVFEVVNSCVNN